jgi:nitrogen fixation-related uncharacterized protein
VSLEALWLLHATLFTAILVVVFLWALRTGQFSQQARVAQMPLDRPQLAPSEPMERAQRRRQLLLALATVLAPILLVVLGILVWAIVSSRGQ